MTSVSRPMEENINTWHGQKKRTETKAPLVGENFTEWLGQFASGADEGPGPPFDDLHLVVLGGTAAETLLSSWKSHLTVASPVEDPYLIQYAFAKEQKIDGLKHKLHVWMLRDPSHARVLSGILPSHDLAHIVFLMGVDILEHQKIADQLENWTTAVKTIQLEFLKKLPSEKSILKAGVSKALTKLLTDDSEKSLDSESIEVTLKDLGAPVHALVTGVPAFMRKFESHCPHNMLSLVLGHVRLHCLTEGVSLFSVTESNRISNFFTWFLVETISGREDSANEDFPLKFTHDEQGFSILAGADSEKLIDISLPGRKKLSECPLDAVFKSYEDARSPQGRLFAAKRRLTLRSEKDDASFIRRLKFELHVSDQDKSGLSKIQVRCWEKHGPCFVGIRTS